MIVHTCFNNSSYHGYKSSVLKSGICKYTRRGEKYKLKWCVMEMARFNEHEKGDGLVTNLVNRLKILIMEELSFDHIGISSCLINLLNMYLVNRNNYELLLSFCDIAMDSRRNRAVSYMNSWWRHEDLHYEKTILDKVLKYKVKGDTDECLLIGENLIYYIENKDEHMFACFSALYKLKDLGLKDQGLRYRRKDATYLWFQIIEDYMTSDKQKTVFKFALDQFHKKNMTERYAFGNWIGLMVWKRDIVCEDDIEISHYSKQDVKHYYESMKKLEIDDYVINDHHVNSNYGLGHFAENGAYVKDEYLDFMEDASEKKDFYIREKKLRDKLKKKKKHKKVSKQEIIETIDWKEFTEVNILEEGVCGGKVCCISVMYKGSKYILKEMRESMNFGLDYILIDKCKKYFGLKDMNMKRIKSNKGQLKIDPTRKSYVGNVVIGDKQCIYCMMDYWPNIGDLGKHKEVMEDIAVKQEALKIRLFDGLFRSSDNIPRNILVNDKNELLSIDEGDIFGKREKIFNKNDWFTKPENCSLIFIESVIDELVKIDKLTKIKKLFEYYQFMNFDEFKLRYETYKKIVMTELQ